MTIFKIFSSVILSLVALAGIILVKTSFISGVIYVYYNAYYLGMGLLPSVGVALMIVITQTMLGSLVRSGSLLILYMVNNYEQVR